MGASVRNKIKCGAKAVEAGEPWLLWRLASCAWWQPARSARLLSRGSQPPRRCSLARQQDRLASAQTMRGWAALARAESWCIRMQAGMPEGSSHRISDGSGTDWRWSSMVSLQTGRLNLRMTQRVQYSAVGRGGCARTHLAPFSEPIGHTDRQFRSARAPDLNVQNFASYCDVHFFLPQHVANLG